MSNESKLIAQTDFGLKLLSTLQYSSESVVFSPLSISLALSLIHSGAEGESKKQLEDVILGSGEYSEYFSQIVKQLSNAENGVQTLIANKVFVNQNYNLKEDYLKDIQNLYKASAQNLNFDDADNSANSINSFVESQTSGKITELVSSELLQNAFALLVNAVYFKADWFDKFEKGMSIESTFYQKEGESREVPFLNMNATSKEYAENESFQVLALPYVDQSFKLAIFLPKEQFGLENSFNKLTGESFQKLLSDLQNTLLNISVPKIKIEKEVSLKESLESIGITEIFSDNANLSRISDGIKISSGVHKSIIEVDEDGTEAAAASGFKATLEMMILNEPKTFVADHPFLFALLHNNVPTFLGTYN